MDLGQQMQQLYQRFGDIDGITIELHKELLAIQVNNEQANATVFLQGAQLSQYQRQGERPLIWNSPLCDYQSGKPLRGGIPVCWPWFGDLNRNDKQVQTQINTINPAAHGFARTAQWQLEDIVRVDAGHTRLQLSLPITADEHSEWPFASQLSLQLDIGDQLELCFTVHNQSMQAFSYSAALHSYFAVSDIDDIVINGLEQCNYIDCMDNWHSKQQQTSLIIDQEVDRIYYLNDRSNNTETEQPISIIDQGWNRAINIASQGSNSAVLWNPWIEKSKHLSNFADDAYQKMLCIETANAAADFVTLEPQQSHQLILRLSSVAFN